MDPEQECNTEETIMKTRRTINTGKGVIVSILAVCSAVLAIVALPVSAAIFNVATFDDELAANGACSLREAIVNANDNGLTHADCPAGEAGPVVDVINLPAGTYTLTLAGVDERCDPCDIDVATGDYVPVVTFDASQGDLDITDDVTITGAGSDVTRIEWAPTSPGVPLIGDNDPLTGDRIFQVSTTSSATADIASVVIQGLTVANGEVAVKPTKAADVCVPDGPLPSTATFDPSKLNAYDIEVIDSTCGSLDEEGKIVDDGTTSIIIAQFRRMGGAIALGGGYATVVYDSTKEGLPPDVISGGEGSSFGVENVSLVDVVVINNWSGSDGGGIHSIVPATISRSKISGNTCAGGNGGGLYNEGDTVISDTLIGMEFDAPAPGLGNPNYGENGGGIFFTGSPQTTTTILRSAINGNEAIGGAGIAGRVARFDIINTTISSNTAKDVGAGIHTAGPVYLQNVTVADNVATTTAPIGGSGLSSFSNGQYFYSNTLLSNNMIASAEGGTPRLANCGCAGGGGCAVGDLNSQGYNLEDGDTCELDQLGDQKDTPTQLMALADNGGLTETHELTFITAGNPGNSPALDTGDDSNCPNNDQRGSIRPFDGDEDGTANCDIGAFELANFTTDLQISNMVAPDEVFKGDQFTVTVTVFNNTANPDANVVLVTDALPAQATFVSASYDAGAGAVDCGGLTCTIGDLAGASSATVTLTLSAAAVGDAVITATVSGDNVDNNEANNTHSVTVGVIGEADLQLTATANTNSVVVGDEVTVTFTVANLGADDATEVSLFGTIPAVASLVSATPDNGTTCTQSGADVFCELGNLAVAGPSISVVAVIRADLVGAAGTVVDVSATADAKQRDPDLSNNTVAASVTITSVPVVPPPSGGGDSGWCSYNPDARFDPVLPGLVLAALVFFGWRLRKTGAR
jgi:uncharacterized repeat protein (TIGR01451 family)/CSLREA domain-containing protein